LSIHESLLPVPRAVPAIRAPWPLHTLLLLALAACGGGDDSGGGVRSGVSFDGPLSSSALAVTPGEAVSHTARCSGNGSLRYVWDAGDGSAVDTGGTASFVHRYDTPGDYLPRVTCTSSDGAEATSAAAAYVKVGVPAHALSAIRVSSVRRPGDGGTDVTFTATCADEQGGVPAYLWTFEGGRDDSGPVLRRSYAAGTTAPAVVQVACSVAQDVKGSRGERLKASQAVTGTTTFALASGPFAWTAPPMTEPLRVSPSLPTTASPTTFTMGCEAPPLGSVSYAFDFGDGSPTAVGGSGHQGIASHAYARDGAAPASQYTVRGLCTGHGADGRVVGETQVQTLVVNVRSPVQTFLAGRIANAGFDRLAFGEDGTLYVTGSSEVAGANHAIGRIVDGRRVDFAGGRVGGLGEGTGPAARFAWPEGLVSDGAGHLYVVDRGNHLVRRVDVRTGEVSTLAGDTRSSGNRSGQADGQGGDASFDTPTDIARDRDGNLYVADTGNNAIRKLTPQGLVSTLADNTTAGPGARFDMPVALAVDGGGNVYVANAQGHHVLKVTPAGAVSVLAGLQGQPGFVDGTGAAARFSAPSGIAVDAAGNVFVADHLNRAVRRITPAGQVGTLAGSPERLAGFVDGTGAAARFDGPVGLAIDPRSGALHVADPGNDAVRVVSMSGQVGTAVSGEVGFVDGAARTAGFGSVAGVVQDAEGTTYVADLGNHAIRRVGRDGTVTTLAGREGVPGPATAGPAAGVRFDTPTAIARDHRTGDLYVADRGNQAIRKIASGGQVTTLVQDDRLRWPSALAVGPDGTVYVADSDRYAIYRIGQDGVLGLLAGGTGRGMANGYGAAVLFGEYLGGLAAGDDGRVYVADRSNGLVRVIDPAGEVSTYAGHALAPGEDPNADPDGRGLLARLDEPVALALDNEGNLYVAERRNPHLRKIDGVDRRVSTLSAISKPAELANDASLPGALSVFGRRLVFGRGHHLEQIDFAP
jgi:sugar lactone lactonase YvrE